MRSVPEALAVAVESGAATLCHVWLVTLKDGARLGFTDHDRPLEVEGVVCSAESGWTAGAADSALGGAPGASAVAGVLDDARVTEAELLGGAWDGAAVELWRVDWSAPEGRVRLQRGTVARVRREGERFTAEVVGPLAALDRVIGRTFGRSCDAWLNGRLGGGVAEVRFDDTPTAVLVRPLAAETVGGEAEWRPDAPSPAAGPPTLHVLDLPPLAGAEDDARPLIAAAMEPWRGLDVWAGSEAGDLTRRVRLEEPATVGVTLSDLPALSAGRMSRGASLLVRLQGRAPTSRTAAEVRGGANRAALQTASGAWELLAFERAEPLSEEVWRLSGLARGLAGTEAFASSTTAGAAVVLLDGGGPVRAEAADAERGLPRRWRAAPAGGPPGGPAAADATSVWRGAALRPWAPAHLRVRLTAGGGRLATWVRRARRGGDGWDVEPPAEAGERWRVELRLDGAVLRTDEVDAPEWRCGPDEALADVAGEAPPDRSLSVSAYGPGWGWGPAATLRF